MCRCPCLACSSASRATATTSNASETLTGKLGIVVGYPRNHHAGHRKTQTYMAPSKTSVPHALLGERRSIPGVQGGDLHLLGIGLKPRQLRSPGPVPSAHRHPRNGRCTPGADVARLSGLASDPYEVQSTLNGQVWPAANISPQRLQDLTLPPIERIAEPEVARNE